MIDPDEHQKRMERHRKKHEKMNTWFWRIFYAAVIIILISIISIIAIVGLLGLHFGEVVEFLRGFQGLVL